MMDAIGGSVARCVANLCANSDADLVSALLDDEQLLAALAEGEEEGEEDTSLKMLPAIVRAFKQLHAQLKDELSCAIGGQQIGDQQLLSSVLSMEQLQELVASNKKSKNGRKWIKFDDAKMSSSADEDEMREESPKICDETFLVRSRSADGGDADDNGEFVEVISCKEANRDIRKAPHPPLELHFGEAVSIQPGDQRCGELLIDRSVQAELPPINSDYDGCGREGKRRERERRDVEESDEDGSVVESVSAAALMIGSRGKEAVEKGVKKQHKNSNKECSAAGSSSSFSTTTPNSSTELSSLGQVDAGTAVQLLARRRPNVTLYTLDAEGALTTHNKRKDGKPKKQRQQRLLRRDTSSPSTSSPRPLSAIAEMSSKSAFNNAENVATTLARTSSVYATAAPPQPFIIKRAESGDSVEVVSLRRHVEEKFEEFSNNNTVFDGMLQQQQKATDRASGGRRTLVAREVSFQSSVDTAILLREEREAENGEREAEKEDREAEEEEELSTLNQVTPIPTTLELSNNSA